MTDPPALPTAADLVGLLAAPDRLQVVAALALGAHSTGQVVERVGLEMRTVLRALTRLEAGGLVEGSEPDRWRLLDERFAEVTRAGAPPPDHDDHGAADPGTAAVLRTFLRDGRLVTIPASRSKRLVVLGHLATLFEVGVRYPEREVDALLRAFHPDYAALRRYLVDETLLSREGGFYWRTGGPVDIAPAGRRTEEEQ